MTTGLPHEPDAHPDHSRTGPRPVGEPEDVVDLNLDDSLDEDLQSVADEVASEYPTQIVPEVDLESALGDAERQMEEMLRREAELMDQHRRLAADFNNFRNRAQRDIALAVEQAERKILLELLPVLDNFDRGLDATYQDVESFRSGVELIRKQFQEALRRMNVEALPLQVGEPFDALHAEALTTFSDPNLPDGAVAAIYERGFKLKGQLLRAARVVVNRLQSS
ncbi:nucleotide exchange factor GrpE [Geothrix oryzae]|jgi:molecular chaperone GrpE|uniref:Protein GrpE n=1 Tax=Geothrix oryzae TaxID=2927975 RepID=A0ABN6UYL1_9BACT|nr:nucleotide exchange factor GrpE [Geothrix oryzae]BDU70079.1 nucleotide exchange factor GrpE [Geothrix oryzae]